MAQEGDVLLFQTNDGGEVTVENGVMEMSGGLATAVYLSLFGGNEDDNGVSDNPFTWWGNRDEIDPVNQYRSETQHLLQSLPATSGNLRNIEDSASRDLEWLITVGAASSIAVVVSIPGLNKIKIVINVNAEGEESNFEFIENWKAQT